MPPADLKDDHEREHKNSEGFKFSKATCHVPLSAENKGRMTEIRNTCTHSTLWKSTLGARVLFKMKKKIKAPLIQPPELCVRGYSKDFPLPFPLFFLFSSSCSPPRHHTNLPVNGVTVSRTIYQEIFQLKLRLQPTKPREPRVCSHSVWSRWVRFCERQCLVVEDTRWDLGDLLPPTHPTPTPPPGVKHGTHKGLLSFPAQYNSQINHGLWLNSCWINESTEDEVSVH